MKHIFQILALMGFLLTGAGLPVQAQTCNYPSSSFVTDITNTTALLNWVSIYNTGVTYEISLGLGTSNTTSYTIVDTVEAAATNTFSLTGLADNTQYTARIRTFCANGTISGYGYTSFRTGCREVYSLGAGGGTSTSKILSWVGQGEPLHRSFTVQYRPQTPGVDWTTIPNLMPSSQYSYTLTGLSGNTTYEWQVQGVCSFGPAPYAAGNNFQTICNVASANSSIGPSYFQLAWTPNEPGQTYRFDWQPQSNPNSWSSVTGITNTFYNLTGLTPNTPYNYRFQVFCANGTQSTPGQSSFRTETCRVPVFLSVGALTARTAQLSWANPFQNATPNAQVQYRVAGSNAAWSNPVSATATPSSPFTLTGLSPTTAYEWQVAAVCAPGYPSTYGLGSDFTTTSSPTCPTPTSLTTTDIFRTGARYSWADVVAGDTERYNVRWRRVGTLNWTTVTGWTVNTYPWASLLVNTAYEWQVQTVCAGNNLSDWSSLVAFTTLLCEPVIEQQTLVFPGGSVVFSWGLIAGSTGGFSYTIRYRLAGTNDSWTMLESIPGTSYQLTGLPENRTYEWQVRLNCSGVTFSDYTALQLFSTVGCPNPPYPQVFGGGFDNGAAFAQIRYGHNFSFLESNTRFNIRWRAVGEPNWQTENNFSSFARVHQIGNLTPNRAYEWQIQTVCGTTGLSAFSPSLVFTPSTNPACFPYIGAQHTLKNGDWTDPTVWSCGTVPGLSASTSPSGSPVELRHAVTLPANTTGWAKPIRYTGGGQLILGTGARIRTTID